MADKGSLKQIIQALSGLPSGATVADFQQAMTPERYAVPMDRRPATIRAARPGERLRDVIERLAGAVQDQPMARALDALLGNPIANTGRGVAPPLLSLGQMPDGPTKASREALAREVAQRVNRQVNHWKYGRGVIESVDNTSYQADADTPIPFAVVRFEKHPNDPIFLPMGDLE